MDLGREHPPMTPSSLAEALTASKLARTTLMAWRSAFHGKPMPSALADALETLVHVGDQITAAGVAMQTAQQLRAAGVAAPTATGAPTPRFTLADRAEPSTGRSVVVSGLESNGGNQ